jgi:arylsulfatase A-like enzyme
MKKKPNIIFILSDDQGYWAMGCAGNKEIRTPNIDYLAKTGIRFENFFCCSPVCSPARASILTGRIPSAHGIHDWLAKGNTNFEYQQGEKDNQLIQYLKGIPGYTDYLSQNGYYCGISGKWHLGDSHHPQKGFKFWRTHARGGGNYYGAPMIKNGKPYIEQRYVTDVITDNALEFLENSKKKNLPFYLSIHYTAPHSPWTKHQHPEDTFDRYYRECSFDSVPYEISKRPGWVKKLNIPVNDEKTRKIYLSGYFTAVEEMDRNIGRILKFLEENSLRNDTLIVFMSDNGMNMGHHGVFGKGNATFPLNMFEESIKVPCIFSHPGIIPEGKINRMLLSQYDILPTILEYSGVKIPDIPYIAGKSFADVLKGKNIKEKDFVVIFCEYGPVRTIRTRRWKYVCRYPYGPDELYDLNSDPGEQKNLSGLLDYRKIEKELKCQLREWFLKHTDALLDGVYLPVTGRGQIDRCNEGFSFNEISIN